MSSSHQKSTDTQPSIDSMLSDLNLAQSSSSSSSTSSSAPSSSLLQKKLSPFGQVDHDLEYIVTPVNPFHGESGGFVPSRGWSDDLCYGTGTAYVSGLGLGGVWGFFQGLNVPLDVSSTKLRINAILNAMSRRGPFVANSLGVLALMYNSFNSALTSQFGKEHSTYASIAAATSSGILYKCTSGIRAAGTSGLICAAMAMLWQGLKQMRHTVPTLKTITTKSYT